MNSMKHLLGSVAIAALLTGAAHAQDTATEAPTEPTETPPESAEAAPTVAADADTVVATVNGTDITVGHMVVALSRLPEQYQTLPDETLFPGILDQLIQQLAVGAQLEGELSKGSQLALENERWAFSAGEVLQDIADGAVTDEALQALYTERYAEAEPAEEYNASHILVETEEEAAEVKAQIDEGADFAEVARERSTGPSGPNGGELGWFEQGMMVEPFEEAVVAMEPGEVAGPIQTQFGWHVIKLNETRLKEAPPLEQVRAELEGELQRRAIDTAIQEATDTAEIVRSEETIDPTVLRNLDLVTE